MMLNGYLEACDRLAESKWIQEGMWSTFNMQMRSPNYVHTSAILPDWDDVIVVLHKYRPIGLQQEPTFFGRVVNVLAKNIDVPFFREVLDRFRQKFAGKDFQSLIKITSNGTVVNAEEVLNAWLNAYEYHQDREKRVFVDDLHRLVPLDSSKAVLLQFLAERIEAALALAEEIRVVLGKRKQVELHL